VVPGKKLTGMKTEMRTSEVAMTALVTSAIAILVASCGSEETVSMPLPVAGPFGVVEDSGAYGSGSSARSVRDGPPLERWALNFFDDDVASSTTRAGGESDAEERE